MAEKITYLSKKDLAKKLATQFKAETGAKITIENTIKFLTILTNLVASEVRDGANVRLHGLADFVGADQDEKEARDPRNGNTIIVPAKRVVTIYKSGKLSKLVAGETVAEDVDTDEVEEVIAE